METVIKEPPEFNTGGFLDDVTQFLSYIRLTRKGHMLWTDGQTTTTRKGYIYVDGLMEGWMDGWMVGNSNQGASGI
jgi:hypothetical protein